MSVYVASKTKYADKWLELKRTSGLNILATWLDEAGVGQSKSLYDLACRCASEAASASALILYCEPGDVLKGALIEVGIAIANGINIYCVGKCETLSKTFDKLPIWTYCCDTMADAVALAARDDAESA